MKTDSFHPLISDISQSLNVVLLLLSQQGNVKQIELHTNHDLVHPVADLIGKNWFETCVPHHSRDTAFSTFNSLFNQASKPIQAQPCPILLASGNEHVFLWYSLPQFNDQQTITSICLIGVDATQQALVEHDASITLERIQANAQIVLDNAVIRMNPERLILSFNRSAETMFGYSQAEVLGKNVNILIPPPYKEQHDDYVKNYLNTGQKKIIGIGREVVGLRKDGSEFPMELSVSEIKVDGEHSFTGIIRDISERKEAEKQLQLRDEELQQIRHRMTHMDRVNVMGEMATGIAHELNQPLIAIATYAQASSRLLDSTINNTNDLAHALLQINEQAQRAGEVIRKLRSMVTKQRQTYQRADINSLVQETIELSTMDTRVKHMSISTQLTSSTPIVELDPIQIQQVLLNLILNAADALEEIIGNKTITLQTLVKDEYVYVMVLDNGPGISADDKREIFNPFFTTKNEGMGMGLAICRSIISAHGGELNINYDNSQCTEFYFTLPLAIST